MQQYEDNENDGYDFDPKQRPPPTKFTVRPRVDPEAEGEVDPEAYVSIFFPAFFGILI